MAARPELIAQIIGEGHPAHPKVVVKIDEFQAFADRARALDVEADREAAGFARGTEILEASDERVAFGSKRELTPERG